MPVNLMNGAPDQAGNWRVAQLPQWNEGDEVSAEDGGSALAVVSQSKQQAAATVRRIPDPRRRRADHGRHRHLPKSQEYPDLKELHRPEHRSQQEGQRLLRWPERQPGPVRSGPAQGLQVRLPAYNPFAQSSFGDQISKAYSKSITLKEAFANYAKALADHGTQQGYTVTNKS